MLQIFDEKPQPLTVNDTLYPFFKQSHLVVRKLFLFTLIFGSCLFFLTLILSTPAFSQSEEAYPEGDKEYFKALIELDKDDDYKKIHA